MLLRMRRSTIEIRRSTSARVWFSLVFRLQHPPGEQSSSLRRSQPRAHSLFISHPSRRSSSPLARNLFPVLKRYRKCMYLFLFCVITVCSGLILLAIINKSNQRIDVLQNLWTWMECSTGFALTFQVRRVRRCNSSSPDSDDTYGGEEDEVGLGKDDQYLVSDRTENKFYGSVHAAAAASSCGSAHQYPGNTPIIGPPLNYLQRRLQVRQWESTFNGVVDQKVPIKDSD